MYPKNCSVSLRNPLRMLSSKSGNISRSGTTFASRLRSCSHWPVKFSTSASARSSSSMRCACAASTLGSRSRPAAARSSSFSSGMLLHRKKDRREASSTSLTGCATPARNASRIFLDSIQKVRARKNARDAGANPIVETAAALPLTVCKTTSALRRPPE